MTIDQRLQRIEHLLTRLISQKSGDDIQEKIKREAEKVELIKLERRQQRKEARNGR